MSEAAPRTASEIVEHFRGWDLPKTLDGYLAYHARRYEATLAYLEPLLDDRRARARAGERPLKVLDVGPGFQTELLRAHVPDGQVDSLGFALDPFTTPSSAEHIEFDLNSARWQSPPLSGYDLIVFLETIEHLHAPPRAVLGGLGAGLLPGGYLVVGTPNGVALHKRLRMLIGRPPVAPMDDEAFGQDHLHEYTSGELVDAGRRASLEIHDVRGTNYFGGGGAARLYGAVGRLLPRNLRHGVLVTYRRALR